jgi:hypothetical protein
MIIPPIVDGQAFAKPFAFRFARVRIEADSVRLGLVEEEPLAGGAN